ncbi:GNAT family N-acetyltransferase [Ruminococcaceae bacterium OttesenSCG-928-D13]|nr:GNAT family N-acetyltransferase [Ruminococcaceae bacterium OttesenSCG-928-D13]
MIEELKKCLSEYDLIPITTQNFEQIFPVYDANQDFFLLTQGERASLENSISDVYAVPKNIDISQKTYVSIWMGDSAVGILDLIEGYPGETSLWIGLLLVHGDLHGKKIGSNIANAVFTSAGILGYKSVQLGVIESNVKGLAFWKRQGFTISGQRKNIVIMAKELI